MDIKKVLILGGSGFIGTHVASRLCARSVDLTIPTRRRDRCKSLTTLPGVELPQIDIHDPENLKYLVAGHDAVINLVGVLHDCSLSNKTFTRAHVKFPELLIAACQMMGVRRLVHVSALGADPAGPSCYLRTKGAGESLIRDAVDLETTIFRPSVVFGEGDSFLTMFAFLLRWWLVIPVGRAGARLQPVFIDDVADAIVDCLDRRETIGRTYELVGPKVYTLRELINYTGKITGHVKPVINLPDGLAMLMAFFASLMPDPMMSPDNLHSLRIDNVASGKLEYPVWQPQSLEAIAPTYLGVRTLQKFLDHCRATARR